MALPISNTNAEATEQRRDVSGSGRTRRGHFFGMTNSVRSLFMGSKKSVTRVHIAGGNKEDSSPNDNDNDIDNNSVSPCSQSSFFSSNASGSCSPAALTPAAGHSNVSGCNRFAGGAELTATKTNKNNNSHPLRSLLKMKEDVNEATSGSDTDTPSSGGTLTPTTNDSSNDYNADNDAGGEGRKGHGNLNGEEEESGTLSSTPPSSLPLPPPSYEDLQLRLPERITRHVLDRSMRKLSSASGGAGGDDAAVRGGGGDGGEDVGMHGLHPSAADTAMIRAANGGSMSAKAKKAMAAVPLQTKVRLHDMEKRFIQSLSEIDNDNGNDPNGVSSSPSNSVLPPLLGQNSPRPELYGPLAGPYSAEKEGDMAGRCIVPLGPKKTLVLDLDETLVSSSRTPCSCDFKIVFKVHSSEPPPPSAVAPLSDNGVNADAKAVGCGTAEDTPRDKRSNEQTDVVKEIAYYVRIRPGLAKFLVNAAALYELVVWTASGKAYADAILNLLDPEGKLFSKRLYREACMRHRGLCVKDLRRLGRPMNSVILLDNYVYSFGFTLNNGIPIAPWTGIEGPNEPGLMIAASLLQRVARAPDVRTPLIKTFDLHRVVHGHRSSSLTPRLFSTSTSPTTTTTTTPAINSPARSNNYYNYNYNHPASARANGDTSTNTKHSRRNGSSGSFWADTIGAWPLKGLPSPFGGGGRAAREARQLREARHTRAASEARAACEARAARAARDAAATATVTGEAAVRSDKGRRTEGAISPEKTGVAAVRDGKGVGKGFNSASYCPEDHCITALE